MDVMTVTLNPSLDREIIIENFKSGEMFRISNPSNALMEPGGKGVNVSKMLSKLGIENMALGFLGGFVGRVFLEKLLEDRNITANFIFVEEETRENIAILDLKNHTITQINSSGPKLTDADIEHFMQRYINSLSLVDHVLISGSVPPNTPDDIYAKMFSLAHERNITTYMEANGRHFNIAVKNACPEVVRIDLRKEKKYFDNELKDIEDYIYAAEDIIKHGAKLAVLSYHVEGDIIATNDGIWLFKVNETIDRSHLFGVGDSFMTGIIYYILKNGKNFLESAKFGMATAIAKVHHVEKYIENIDEIHRYFNYFETKKVK
ncbi:MULTISPECIES: 1-phosphofructokinase family hexose kinase [unclassified Marinitoga]|uniref:1-phosphofructokinase family hexose kinase n=1 Tax=unclassified Marinitoga TaxID=2640159 RepID=UPI0006416820|nr:MULTISPECIES: 1-phosphofructokinase family hexose kinase [unclassified Marinitoga]KLO25078.1 ribokinase [Marinitoga sp. 1155]NUU98629.1 ribokinase [Marinitoga sp. 1154]